MRWIVTSLIVAMFAWANIAPQAAWADLDVDRLKKRVEDAKGDVEREKKDAKGDVAREKKDAKGDVKREKKDAKGDVKRDLKH
jgi:hypothetical protein